MDAIAFRTFDQYFSLGDLDENRAIVVLANHIITVGIVDAKFHPGIVAEFGKAYMHQVFLGILRDLRLGNRMQWPLDIAHVVCQALGGSAFEGNIKRDHQNGSDDHPAEWKCYEQEKASDRPTSKPLTTLGEILFV
jgi:hypothetical protein